MQIWNNHHIFMYKYPFEKNIDFYKIYILRMSIWKKLTILSYNITLYLLLFHVTFIQNIFSTNINLFYYYYLEDSSSISDIWYTVSQKHLNYFIGNLINLILIKIYIYIYSIMKQFQIWIFFIKNFCNRINSIPKFQYLHILKY